MKRLKRILKAVGTFLLEVLNYCFKTFDILIFQEDLHLMTFFRVITIPFQFVILVVLFFVCGFSILIFNVFQNIWSKGGCE